MSRFIARIYYSGVAEGSGATPEEAVKNAESELPPDNCYDGIDRIETEEDVEDDEE